MRSIIVLILGLTLFSSIKGQDVGWCNLQHPPSAQLQDGQTVDVYAQVWVDGVTNLGSPGAGVEAWIGVNNSNTDPSTWVEGSWTVAAYNGDVGNNDEYMLAIGAGLDDGVYYYASRFRYNGQAYYYGGTAGFWAAGQSGLLTINSLDWCNLQFPQNKSIKVNETFDIYAQVLRTGTTDAAGQGANIEAWIGYSTSNTNPSTWTNWVVASFNQDVGNNDEYTISLGTGLAEGTYYYASRFRSNGRTFYYGGYNAGGGGFWDGAANVSGILNIASIDWCNLQHPGTASIRIGETLDVYARILIDDVTDRIGLGKKIDTWIGWNREDTNPRTWGSTQWEAAEFNLDYTDTDEVKLSFGSDLSEGTYYYASRFSYDNNDYYYGGYNASGGGFWDGATNVSGELTVKYIEWCNLQWPPADTLKNGDSLSVYAQIWMEGITEDTLGAGEGIEAWIGYYDKNHTPKFWPEDAWVPAQFNGNDGNNDEFVAQIGYDLPDDVYYFASRFRYKGGGFVYGGYNAGGGDFWDSGVNISGILTLNSVDWCSLEPFESDTLTRGDSLIINADVWIKGKTDSTGHAEGLQAWVGFFDENTDPSAWPDTNWTPLTLSSDTGDVDTYSLTEVIDIPSGDYFFASRFKLNNSEYFFGGVSDSSGGMWDGVDTISQTLTVLIDSSITWCNIIADSTFIFSGDTAVISGLVYAPEITDSSTGGFEGVKAWIGVYEYNFDPILFPDSTWFEAVWVSDSLEMDLYSAEITKALPAGTFYCVSRFQFRDGDYIYGGYSNDGGGIWDGDDYSFGILEIDAPVGINEDESLPNTFKLMQNYPNPFNPTTTIQYTLPVESHVKISIYNVMGEMIAILADGIKNSGLHQTDWNAHGFATGVYFYALRAEGTNSKESFVEIKKMLLIK